LVFDLNVRRFAVVGVLLVGACASPSQPSAPGQAAVAAIPPLSADDVTGVWRGTLQIDQCTGVCNPRTPVIPFTVTVLPRSDGYAALLVTETMAATLTGARGADGSVVFSGASEPSPVPEGDELGAVVQRFRLAVDAATGLAGDFEYVRAPLAPLPANVRGHIASAERSSPAPDRRLEGEWRGRYVGQSCTGDCEGFFHPGTASSFHLRLSRSGSTLSGWFVPHAFPVEGTLLNDVGVISGEHVVTNCPDDDWEGVYCTQRLVSLSATVDEFGTMRGPIQYYSERADNRRHAATVTGVLWNVFRR
jgi:hypothetical protein